MKRKLDWKILWTVFALPLVVPAVSGALAPSISSPDELVVVVHQLPQLEEATISLLDEPRHADSPRVMLTDGSSYPLTPALAERATLVQFSLQGELSLDVDAKTVTLIGGSANDCLKRTAHLLIKEIFDHRGRGRLTLRLPSEVVWGWKHEAGGLTLHDSFCQGNPAGFESKVKEFAETFIRDENFPDLFRMTRIYQIEPGREGGMDYGFVFTRLSDGKQMNLIIEQLCDAS